ncbi:MAG TPA: M20 family metallopeptidase [Firmicutes bacterium]|nr:M20 family metallopeptidase [Bacillota bacterium]
MGYKDVEALWNESCDSEVLSLCQNLVRINTTNPPGNEEAAVRCLVDYLKDTNVESRIISHGKDRASVVFRLKGAGNKDALLFNGHVDTVPAGNVKWVHDPFAGEIADGKIWGRGASDMKGGIAAMAVAMACIARSGIKLAGDLILAATAGEEIDSLGAMAVADRASEMGPVQAIVIGEPSYNEVFIAEKGALWLEVCTFGKTAHGSMPELGNNAITMMLPVISAIEEMEIPFEVHPYLGGFTKSINTISGGVKVNVVPDLCAIQVDMRTVPGQQHQAIVARVEEILRTFQRQRPGFSAALKVVNDRPPVATSPDDPAVKLFSGAVARVTGKMPKLQGVAYYTDATALVPAFKCPMVICGPGAPGAAHQPDEWVEIGKLSEAGRIYVQAALNFLAEEGLTS